MMGKHETTSGSAALQHSISSSISSSIRVPLSTYRLQFTAEFGFRDATGIIEYLRELGVSDIYASPIFQARSGSTHGYDVVDPNRLNPELGSEQDFTALHAEVQRCGLGWLQDIVPNHMAYDGANWMLMDVLENGRASRFAESFDIEWNHPYESLKEKVLAPFLGAFYGECLESGQIQLGYAQDGFSIRYHALRLPLQIASYATLLGADLARLRRRLGPRHPDLLKLSGVLYALKNLPHEEDVRERAEQNAFVRRRCGNCIPAAPRSSNLLMIRSPRSMARPAMRRASMRWIDCSRSRRFGCRFGRLRPRS
jgi:(1->4)-alpha-D-glucan 1-alpha-D-glucosylmutase